MNTEKVITALSGYLAFVLILVLIAAAALCFWADQPVAGAIICVINFVFILPGLAIVDPNQRCLPCLANIPARLSKTAFFG